MKTTVPDTFSIRHGRPWHTLNGHFGPADTVAVTCDGSRAVSASDDGTLKVWDLRTFKPFLALTAHDDAIVTVALVPDGSRVISASRDHTLKVWDLWMVDFATPWKSTRAG
jgi:WD40 repeat protein